MGARTAVVGELEAFRRRLVASLGSVDHVLLFGSQASGTTHQDSDVDVIVVSRAFEGMGSIDRAVLAGRAWTSHLPVDILCYTPEQFERLSRQVSIVSVAIAEGIEIGAT